MDYRKVFGPPIYDLVNLTAVGQLPSQAHWQLQYQVMQREQEIRSMMERVRTGTYTYRDLRRDLNALAKVRQSLSSLQFSRPGSYTLPVNPHVVNNFLN